MARRGSRARQRDLTTQLIAPVPLPTYVPPMSGLASLNIDKHGYTTKAGLRGYNPDWDDRRTYHPQKRNRPLGVIASQRSAHRDARRLVSKIRSPLSGVRFLSPNRVVLCVKRKMRKQVLFALGRTGKGSRTRYRRRNEWSNVYCK